jgi:hypothetical protein
VIVDPSAKPIPLTANLVDPDYKPVATLTLPQMAWPPHLRWRGRIFAIYHHTVAFEGRDIQELGRTQLYREIEVYDVDV